MYLGDRDYNPFSDSICYENHIHTVKWRAPIRERARVYNKPITEQKGAVYKGRSANGEEGGFEISDIPGRGEGGGL